MASFKEYDKFRTISHYENELVGGILYNSGDSNQMIYNHAMNNNH